MWRRAGLYMASSWTEEGGFVMFPAIVTFAGSEEAIQVASKVHLELISTKAGEREEQ